MDNLIHLGFSKTLQGGKEANSGQRFGRMLCLNAGSSSLKFKLFDVSTYRPDSIALIGGSIKLDSFSDTARVDMCCSSNDQHHSDTKEWSEIASGEVLAYLFSTMAVLLGEDLGIMTVVHRIVHGAHLDQCVSITRDDQHHLHTLQFLAEFAPLHNAVSVQLIKVCLNSTELNRKHTNVCCFDTNFHRSMDEVKSGYMVDPNLAGERLPGGMKLRKWGFHGLSYASVLSTVSRSINKDAHNLNLIMLHLGSGSSICSVVRGRSFDTSMGLTPLEGLPGGTRSGSVDPVLALHLSSATLPGGKDGTVEIADGIRVSRAEVVLNKHSGFKAVAGSSDFAEIVQRRNEFLQGRTMGKHNEEERSKDRSAVLAFDMFVDRIVGFIGAYVLKMCSAGGVDAVVLAGGIGEKSHELWAELASKVELSSVSVSGESVVRAKEDESKCWQLKREELRLEQTNRTTAMGQCVPWLVCRTDEEGEMAKEVIDAWVRGKQ